MIPTPDSDDRRILSFPAVYPCDCVSPATLLDSLITLCRSITDYRFTFFVTQKRNAGMAIHQVRILLLLFEEIQEQRRPPIFSCLLRTCLSELHVAFQNIRFQLEDCARGGARLWMLMKAHSVAAKFRDVIREAAMAIEVLPWGSIDASLEIKELVELVAKQLRKSKIEIDPDDECAIKQIKLILNQFQNNIEPNSMTISWVLDYLGIKNWYDCQTEINFMEELTNSDSGDKISSELPLLSSLIGLLNYCRGVHFENFGFGNIVQSERRCNFETINCLNPQDFRCPISLDLMIDPVTISSGHTFDRASIQKWLKSGHMLCPKTGGRLITGDVVPNSSLRKLIHQFCAFNGVSISKFGKEKRDVSKTVLPGSPAAGGAMKILAKILTGRLYYGTEEQRNKAAYETRLLSKSSVFNGHCLIKSGVTPPLLELLCSNDPRIQETAIGALLKLSKHSNGKKAIMRNGGLNLIVSVLNYGTQPESRQIAAAIIFYLSSVSDYRRQIGHFPEAVPGLVELIRTGSVCGKKNAVVAILGLLLHRCNHELVLQSGAVPHLLDLVSSCDKSELTTDSLAVLATLAENVGGSIAILQKTSALSLITGILNSSISRLGTEYCVSILLSLCNNYGSEVIAVLANDPSIMTTLYSILTDGTPNAGRKARLLIGILLKFLESRASPSKFKTR